MITNGGWQFVILIYFIAANILYIGAMAQADFGNVSNTRSNYFSSKIYTSLKGEGRRKRRQGKRKSNRQ